MDYLLADQGSDVLNQNATAPDEAPFSFERVKKTFEFARQQDPFFSGMTLQDFSRYMNRSLGTGKYAAGDVGGFGRAVKEVGSGWNQLVKPLSEATGAGFGALGDVIWPSQRETFKMVGEELPAFAGETAGFIGGLGLTAGGAPYAGIPLMATSLGLTGARSYEKTGSPLAAGISAATLGATPFVGPAARAVGARAAVPIGAAVERALGSGAGRLAEKGIEGVAEQAGFLGLQEAGHQAQSLAATGKFADPFDPENLAAVVAGTLPFAPLVARDILRGPSGAQILRDTAMFRNVVEASKRTAMAGSAAKRQKTEEVVQEPLPSEQTRSGTQYLMDFTKKTADEVAGVPAEVPLGQAKTLEDYIKAGVAKGKTSRQVLDQLPPEMQAGITGDTAMAKARTLKPMMDKVRNPVKVEKMLFEEQLQGNTFGSLFVEQLNAEKPFGYVKSKQNTLPAQSLRKQMGKLSGEELEMFDAFGLQDFLKKQKDINLKELQDWLVEHQPQVEVKVLRSGETRDSQGLALAQKIAELTHELDTKYPGWENSGVVGGGRLSEEGLLKVEELRNLQNQQRQTLAGPRSQSFDPDAYRSVAPKDKDQSVVLVRVPTKGKPEMSENPEMVRYTRVGDFESDAQRKVVHRGSHFGPEDYNVLGWARVQYEDTPTGKVAHVIEVQSDWGQRQREMAETMRRRGATDEQIEQAQRRGQGMPALLSRAEAAPGHPLLKNTNRLVLKAAIRQALKDGADFVAISDAETAMMTEGHDAAARSVTTRPIGKWVVVSGDRTAVTAENYNTQAEAKAWLNNEQKNGHFLDFRVQQVDAKFNERFIPQEQGMRLNYDRLLPGIAESLTGEKGQRVDFGEHQRAFEAQKNYGTPPSFNSDVRVQRENLLFKNPDGTPKTNVTALQYPLAKVRAGLLARGGFSFFGRDAVNSYLRRLESEGVSPEQMRIAAENLEGMTPRKGETPVDTIAREAGLRDALNQPNDTDTLLATTREFFRRLFTAQGESPERTTTLTNQAMRVAARFVSLAGKTRIVPAEGSFWSVGPRNEVFNAIAGIADVRGKLPGASRDAEVFQTMWGLGHELSHIASIAVAEDHPGTTPEMRQAYTKAWEAASSLTGEEKSNIIGEMLRWLVPPDKVTEVSTVNRRRYGTPEGTREFLADYWGLMALGTAEKKAMPGLHDMIRFSTEETQSFSKAIYRELSGIFGAVKEWMSRVWKALFGVDGKAVSERVDTIHKNLTSLMDTQAEAERAVTTFNALAERALARPGSEIPALTAEQVETLLNSVTQAPFQQEVLGKIRPVERMDYSEELLEARELAVPNAGFGKRVKWWEKMFSPMGQLVRKYPELQETFDLAMSWLGVSANNTRALWSDFADEKGNMDWARLRRIGKDDSALNTAIKDIALVQNADQEILTRDQRDDVSAAYRRLSEEDKTVVDTSLDQFNAIAQKAAVLRGRAFYEKIISATSRILQSHNKAMVSKQAEAMGAKAARVVFDTPDVLLGATPLDPATKAVMLAEVRALPGGDRALQAATSMVPAYKKLLDTLLGPERTGRVFYMPEVRYKDWHVSWTDPAGEKHLEHFSSEAEAGKRLRGIQNTAGVTKVRAYNRQDKIEKFRGLVQEDFIQRYADADKALLDSTVSHLREDYPDAEAALNALQDQFEPGDGAFALLTSPYMMQREFVGGREKLNFVEGMIHYIDATANGISKGFVKGKQALVLNDPALRANPALQNTAREYLKYVTDPQGREFTTLKNLVFFNYLGLNPSALLVEQAQQAMTLVPFLIREGVPGGQAYKRLASAWNEQGKAALAKGRYADPELDAAVNRAIGERVIDTGFIQDLYGEQDAGFVNAKNMLSGNGKVHTASELLGKPLYQMMAFARRFYSMSAQLNSRIAFTTLFKLGRERGMDVNDAYTFAVRGTNVTMFGGGRINRPLALTKMGSWTGVGGLLYSLQGYTFNSLAMMGRLMRESISKELPRDQRRAALKAAGTMLGTQFLLGGTLGLPFVGAGLALVDQLFPEAETKRRLRGSFKALAGDDEDMGHIIADGAMSGVFNALTPVDAGSRFQLGNMLGVSPYDGFSWKNLVGPAGAMVENYTKGAVEVANGEFGTGLTRAVPSGIRTFVRSVKDGGKVTDAAGRAIFEPTAAEQTLLATGFKPKRLTQYYEQQAMELAMERAEQHRNATWRRDMAQRLIAGETQGVREALYQKQAEYKPNYFDVRAELRNIVELAQDMVTPRTLGSGGLRTAATAGEVRSLYPQSREPSATARLQGRAAVERTVGLPGGGRLQRGELRRAMIVDRLRELYPHLSMGQIEALVDQRTNPRGFVQRFGR